MALKVGELFGVLHLEDKPFYKSMANAEGNFNKFGSTITNIAKKGAAIAGAAIVGLGATVLATAKKTADYADIIDKTAQRMGLSTDATQEWSFITEQLGTDLSSLERGLTRFQKRIGEADDGLSSAQRAFENLGVSIYNSDGSLRSMDTIFPEVIKKLSDMEDTTKRNQLAMELFGRGGKDLIPILNAGSDGIDQLSKKARESGMIMEHEAVLGWVALKDQTHALTETIKGMMRQIATYLLPIFRDQVLPLVEKKLIPAIKNLSEFIQNNMGQIQSVTMTAFNMISTSISFLIDRVIPALIKGITFIKENFDVIAPAIAAMIVKLLIPKFIALATVAKTTGLATIKTWLAILGPVALVGAAVAALAWTWKRYGEVIKVATERLVLNVGLLWNKMKKMIYEVISSIMESAQPLVNLLPQSLQNAFNSMSQSVSQKLQDVDRNISTLNNNIAINTGKMTEALNNLNQKGFDVTKNKVKEMTDSVKTDFNTADTSISTSVEGIKSSLNSLKNKTKETTDNIKENVKEVIKTWRDYYEVVASGKKGKTYRTGGGGGDDDSESYYNEQTGEHHLFKDGKHIVVDDRGNKREVEDDDSDVPGWLRGHARKFDTGGIVPRPKGMPTPAIVHGGETILPTHKKPIGNIYKNIFNIYETSDPNETARQVVRILRMQGV